MYASSQDLQDRFGEAHIKQIADRDHSGTADPLLLEQVLLAASSEVDAALSGRYATPLDTANLPPMIKEIVLTLAESKLYSGGTIPEGVENAAKEARGQLKQLSSGNYTLRGVAAASGAQTAFNGGAGGGVVAATLSETRDSDLRGFGA